MVFLRKIYGLLSPRKRWQFLGVFISTVVMGLVATVGVVSIMPFMAVVANPEVIGENRWLLAAYEFFGFETTQGFLFTLGLLTLGVITASNAVSAFNAWLIARFTWGLNHDISWRLFEKYLAQSYAFFIGRNSSELAKNVLAEVAAVVKGAVEPIIQFMSKAIVATCILGMLLYVDVLLAVIVTAVFSIMYGGIYISVRKRQGLLGRRKVDANSDRYRIVGEAFGGIKDVKVLGRENHFLERLYGPSYRYARAQSSNAIVSQLPRYALEAIAFGGILLIVLYLLRTYQELDQVLPIVSLYAFAAYRLMPAFQQMFASLAKARYNMAALDDLYDDLVAGKLDRLRELQLATKQAMGRHPVDSKLKFEEKIEMRDVWFRYPGADEYALRKISLEIRKNTTVAFVGHTGSGKTTLADLLLGLVEPTTGSILADDIVIEGNHKFRWRAQIGYVPQQIYLSDDTIRRNIAFGLPEKDVSDERVEQAARIAQLDEFVDKLSNRYETIVGEKGVRLSGGQRQRIGIARALYGDPDVLILDEATSALDNLTENVVMDAIHRLAGRKTIVLVAHRLSTVSNCDEIVMLKNGRIVGKGPFPELIKVNSEFRKMAGASQPQTSGLGLSDFEA